MISRNFPLGYKVCNLDNDWLPDPSEWKYGILLAAEEVVRAGAFSYVPGSESEKFHLFHPSWIGQVFVFWVVLVCWGGAFAVCCLVWLADQSVRSCYQ